MIRIGTKLVCMNYEGWEDDGTLEETTGPAFEENVTVRRIEAKVSAYDGDIVPIFWFDEYPGDTDDDSFYGNLFAPVEQI